MDFSSRIPRGHIAITLITLITLAACGDSGNGTSTPVVQGLDEAVRSIALAPDGSGDVYIGGQFSSYNGFDSARILRLNSDGSEDSNFAANTTYNATVYSIVPTTDGSYDIYAGGGLLSSDSNGVPGNSIECINSDGSVDAGFTVSTDVHVIHPRMALANDGSGDLYVVGQAMTYGSIPLNSIIRFNNDGSTDGAFAVGSGFIGDVVAVVPAIDGSGDVYVGGWFISYNGVSSDGIIRLNSNGSIDTGFNVGTGFSELIGYAAAIANAADGSGDIYVGGRFTIYNGSNSNSIIRLNNDGSVDTNFDVGTGFSDIYDNVETIVPAADGTGDIYVGGDFSTFNGTTIHSIVRLNNDGSVDTGFVVGSGFDGPVYSIAQADDGSGDIYVGGWFTSYNGTGSHNLIRLNSDGSVDSTFKVNRL